MLAAEARRRNEAEAHKKKLQQLEEDKKMAAKLVEHRKEEAEVSLSDQSFTTHVLE